MGRHEDPAGTGPDELARALKQANEAGRADPDAADIAADDAGASAMAETAGKALGDGERAKPPPR